MRVEYDSPTPSPSPSPSLGPTHNIPFKQPQCTSSSGLLALEPVLATSKFETALAPGPARQGKGITPQMMDHFLSQIVTLAASHEVPDTGLGDDGSGGDYVEFWGMRLETPLRSVKDDRDDMDMDVDVKPDVKPLDAKFADVKLSDMDLGDPLDDDSDDEYDPDIDEAVDEEDDDSNASDDSEDPSWDADGDADSIASYGDIDDDELNMGADVDPSAQKEEEKLLVGVLSSTVAGRILRDTTPWKVLTEGRVVVQQVLKEELGNFRGTVSRPRADVLLVPVPFPAWVEPDAVPEHWSVLQINLHKGTIGFWHTGLLIPGRQIALRIAKAIPQFMGEKTAKSWPVYDILPPLPSMMPRPYLQPRDVSVHLLLALTAQPRVRAACRLQRFYGPGDMAGEDGPAKVKPVDERVVRVLVLLAGIKIELDV